jgi:hypothetical protein
VSNSQKEVSLNTGLLRALFADTERVIETLKEDLVWPNDFESPFDLQPILGKWVND